MVSTGIKKTADPLLRGAAIGGLSGLGLGGVLGYRNPTDKRGKKLKDPTFGQKLQSATRGGLHMGVGGAMLGAMAGDMVRAARMGRAGFSAASAGRKPSWMGNVKTKSEAKKHFRAAAMRNHPDRGGSEEAMKRINAEWNAFQKSHAFEKLSALKRILGGRLPTSEEMRSAAFLDELSKIASLEGLVLGQLVRHQVRPPVMDAVEELENKALARWRQFNQ